MYLVGANVTIGTNAGYKCSDVVNDLNWDVVVTSLSFVKLALTGKLKSSTLLFCFEISNFTDKQVFLLFRLSFVYNLSFLVIIKQGEFIY